MSNISTAYGKIKIECKSVESLATLLTLQAVNNSKEFYYPTNLYICNKCIDIYSEKGTDENEKAFFLYHYLLNKLQSNKITLDFSGNGRWNFCGNVKWFFNCLTLENFKGKKKPCFLKYLENVAQNEIFRVTFRGFDTEEEIQFLSKFKTEVTYKKGNIKTEDIYYKDIEYTKDNLKKYGFEN